MALMALARVEAVHEVLESPGNPATELRDAEQLRMVEVLRPMQHSQEGNTYHPLIYYCGSGFGVDHAGFSTLLRSTACLAAFGYNYDPIFQKKMNGVKHWNPEWLNGCILLVQPPRTGEILDDHRFPFIFTPAWTFSTIRGYDTRTQSVSQLLGDAWNAPVAYAHPEFTRFRYLMGKTGALVIWSPKVVSIMMKVTAHADRQGTRLETRNLSDGAEFTHAIPMWQGEFDLDSEFHIGLKLQPGPNVILFTPQGDDAPPWILFWRIELYPDEAQPARDSSP